MYLVKEKKTLGKIYIAFDSAETVKVAALSFFETVKKITGSELEIERIENLTGEEYGVVLATFEESERLGGPFFDESRLCKGDGFCVKRLGTQVFVLSHTQRGVFFGAHDLLEKNADVVWGRGAKEERMEFLSSDCLKISKTDYTEESPFAVRSWNLCGIGTEGREHSDEGTAAYLAKNKCNGVSHLIENNWRKYGLYGAGVALKEVGNLDELAKEHPEYFMTAPDGGVMPAHCGWDSFLNYYNEGIAKEFARRLVQGVERLGGKDVGIWIMPDNPYFCMIQNGVKLHEQPFVADDGTRVEPSDKNYRSTVYFNFLNRVMKEANRIRPNTYLQVFAYTYSEQAPAIEIDERLIVALAPIQTNEKYSYTDKSNHDNDSIRDNIEIWAKKAKKLALYTYWGSFRGTIYSRPNLKEIKENLLWFKKLGVYQIEIEGKVDCSYLDDLKPSQKSARKYYDLNEGYIWAMNKLLWNPEEDIGELLARYCRIVYKECEKEMLEYFSLLQYGWDKQDALVWYATGGDVYYLQFVVNAGVADKILQTLERAKDKAITPSVKRKIDSIKETVEKEIEKYKNFEKEEAEVAYCALTEKEITSKEQLDYINNPQSVWNTATPLTVLRDYGTMEYYPKEAKFSCRMLYDEENIYIGYTIFDDKVLEERTLENGRRIVVREDGSELVSYTETYIGGNAFNQSVYYGYISGFMGERNEQGSFYENAGSPKNIPIPDGVKDVKFVKFSDKPQERYYFHVQVIPFTALGATKDTFTPYGSFVYYTDRFGRAGWMGYGLWSKQNFSNFKLKEKNKGEKYGS